MKAIVTVGLGFGDEGKGATVDFLARDNNADLVVRYCGGAQAGHNVQLPGTFDLSERHTFSQFGSGTLAGVNTYLGPRMIICPSTLGPEAQNLIRLGVSNPYAMLTANSNCLLSTKFHIAMNRLREISRRAQRHGSCGLGIGESRSYWLNHGLDACVMSDLSNRQLLIEKLTIMRDRFLLELQKLDHVDPHYAETIYTTRPAEEADNLIENMERVAVSERMPDAELAIFEGAQGVLLDEYFGFHPYTTWSTVTPLHAMEILAETGFERVITLGLTRAYSTRHGAGPFPSFCKALTGQINDKGNPQNDWQGKILSGPLDLILLKYAMAVVPIDGLVVNHLDELPESPRVCRKYNGCDSLTVPRTMREQEAVTEALLKATPEYTSVSKQELLAELQELCPIFLTGNGPTADDRTVVRELSMREPDM